MGRVRDVYNQRSYTIVKWIFGVLQCRSILDVTYGVGRFYRKIKRRRYYIIGVDIARHKWEVKPNIFIQYDTLQLPQNKKLLDKIRRHEPCIVVVDPPWSQEKRGRPSKIIGVRNQPYHIKGVRPIQLIQAALDTAKKLKTPRYLLYKYHKKLPMKHIILIRAHYTIFGKQTTIYYGVIEVNKPTIIYLTKPR